MCIFKLVFLRFAQHVEMPEERTDDIAMELI